MRFIARAADIFMVITDASGNELWKLDYIPDTHEEVPTGVTSAASLRQTMETLWLAVV